MMTYKYAEDQFTKAMNEQNREQALYWLGWCRTILLATDECEVGDLDYTTNFLIKTINEWGND